jgi:Tol biopolymer transport system component
MIRNLRKYKLTLLIAALLLIWLAFGARILKTFLENGGSVALGIVDAEPASLNLSGTLYYPKGAEGIWQVDFDTGDVGQWWTPPEGGAVGGIALSPDGTRFAVAYAAQSEPGEEIGAMELYLLDVETQTFTLLLARGILQEEFRNPVWTPDGAWIYYTHYRRDDDNFVPYPVWVERVDSDSGETQVITVEAQYPALSHDGTRLAYVGFDEANQTLPLFVSDPYGGEVKMLFDGAAFFTLSSPRFTPDDSQIVFSASGEMEESTTFDIGSASAHFPPWDLWRIPTNGGDLSPVTSVNIDDPWLTYAPDGEAMAILATEGVLIFQKGRMYRIADSTIRGDLVWTNASRP